MGPCPFRHGYRFQIQLHTLQSRCFNGAMPFQAWIPWSTQSVFRHTDTLQWGHALSGMDTPTGCRERTIDTELQWGHALSGMDTSGYDLQSGNEIYASMGPCPFRHGYSLIFRQPKLPDCASMGPCPFRHGYQGGTYNNAFYLACFNGAMPFQAWILRAAVEYVSP